MYFQLLLLWTVVMHTLKTKVCKNGASVLIVNKLNTEAIKSLVTLHASKLLCSAEFQRGHWPCAATTFHLGIVVVIHQINI